MIRAATFNDLPIIAEIYHQSVGKSPMITPIHTPRSDEEWLIWFNDHPQDRFPIYILEIEDRVVGWGAINCYSHLPTYEGMVSRSTYICQTEHGKGFGTHLRNYGRELARSLGYHTLISYVHEGNKASEVMAEKEGMAKWATFPKAATCGSKRWDFYIYGMTLS